jgi:hypothetical protein
MRSIWHPSRTLSLDYEDDDEDENQNYPSFQA